MAAAACEHEVAPMYLHASPEPSCCSAPTNCSHVALEGAHMVHTRDTHSDVRPIAACGTGGGVRAFTGFVARDAPVVDALRRR